MIPLKIGVYEAYEIIYDETSLHCGSAGYHGVIDELPYGCISKFAA